MSDTWLDVSDEKNVCLARLEDLRSRRELELVGRAVGFKGSSSPSCDYAALTDVEWECDLAWRCPSGWSVSEEHVLKGGACECEWECACECEWEWEWAWVWEHEWEHVLEPGPWECTPSTRNSRALKIMPMTAMMNMTVGRWRIG